MWSLVVPPRSLNVRVTLFTLGIFLIALWTLTFLANRILRADMEVMLGAQQLSTAAFVAEDLNRSLEDRIDILTRVARRVAEVRPKNAAAMQALLEERLILEGPFNGGVAFMDTKATVIAEIPRSAMRVGINYMDRPYIATALTQGVPAISPPVIGKRPLTPLFGIAVPVKTPEGKVIGVMVGATFLDKPNFLDTLTERPYGKTGSYLLVSRSERVIVTTSDKSRVGEVLPPAGVNTMLDRFIDGQEGTGRLVNPRGVEVLVAVKTVPAANWYVAVTLPVSEAFAPIDAMMRLVLLASAILSVVAGVLTWWILQRQLAPMRRAAAVLANAGGEGSHLPVLPGGGQDEIGLLINGFNRLLDVINQREAALRASDEMLGRILATTLDGFWQVDAKGCLIEVNPTYCTLSGYPREALLGMSVEAFDATPDRRPHGPIWSRSGPRAMISIRPSTGVRMGRSGMSKSVP